MIAPLVSSAPPPAIRRLQSAAPRRAAGKRDLSIHNTWIIWRLVFLPGLIYRGVIIRRSQRRRRRRSCITILRRARLAPGCHSPLLGGQLAPSTRGCDSRPYLRAQLAPGRNSPTLGPLHCAGFSVVRPPPSAISHFSNFGQHLGDW